MEVSEFRRRQAGRGLRPYELLWGDNDRRAMKDPAAADRIVSEGWRHAGFEPVKLDPPIAWEEVCAANRSWEFHLQSWDLLGPVLAAYWVEPEERRDQLDRAVRVAVDWVERYPSRGVKSRFAWYDMSVAARGYRLGFLLDAALRLDDYGDGLIGLLVDSVLLHAELMSDDSLFAEHSNHGFFFAAGQLALARRFPELPSMREAERQALDRLRRVLAAHFTEEGVHREHSPDYHRRMLNGLKGLADAGLLDDPHFQEARQRIEEALSWFILPNGRLAAFGDTDSLDMTKSELVDVESAALRFATTQGRDGKPPSERLKAFPKSGYAVVRDAPHADNGPGLHSYLAQACAFHSRSHKHADDLAFIWYDRGHELLVDAGRFGYVGRTDPDSELAKAGFWYSDPRRIYVESTRAHNTVEIDDRSHERVDVEPFGSALRRSGTRDGIHFLESEVTHRESIRHQRLILLRPGEWLIVIDWLDDELMASHSFTQRFHFAPSLELISAEDRLRVSSSELSEPLHVVPFGESTLVDPVRGQEEPELLGWISPRGQEMTACWTAAYRAEGVPRHAFATLLAFGESAPLAFADGSTFSDSTGRIELQWRADGVTHRLEVSRPPAGDLRISYQRRGLLRRLLGRAGGTARRARSKGSLAPVVARRSREAGIRAYRSGNGARARRALRLATRLEPSSLISWLYLARAERDAGQLERSLSTISRPLASRPGWPAGLWHAADLQVQLGRPQEARRTLSAAEGSLEDQDVEQLLRVGRLATSLELPDLAHRVAQHLLEREPENDKVIELAAVAARTVEDEDRAIAIAEQVAITAKGGLPTAATRVVARRSRETGFNAYRSGDLKRARQAFRRATELNPESSAAWEYLARAERSTRRVGDNDPALTVAEEAAARKTQGPLAAAIRLFLRFGRPQRALDLLPSLETRDPTLLLALGRSLRQHGYLRQAVELLERAETDETNPDLEELRVRLRGDLRLHEGWTPEAPPPMAMAPVAGRILHLTGSSLPHTVSGYTVRTQNVVQAQRAAGLDPYVLTQAGAPGQLQADGQSAFERETVGGIPYYRLARPDAGRLPADERLQVNVDLAARALEGMAPAILHPASDYHNALIALSLRQATNLPVVYEVRGFWEETWLSRQPEGAAESDAYVGRRDTETRCMLEADHVVTLAEVMKRHIVDRGVPPDKVTVVPNAVDPEALRSAPPAPDLARRFGIDSAETVLGYTGSLVEYEGLDDLIRAVALLRERGEAVRCLIVGDGRERTNLELLAADLGISDRVAFTGTVPPNEVPRYYQLIDTFVLPRRRNRVCELVTPLKPFEAMAMGCAVVVSDLDALKEIVADGETGLVTPPEDPAALAEALEGLAGDPDRRRALATAASDWVREERTWAGNAEVYGSIYEAVRP